MPQPNGHLQLLLVGDSREKRLKITDPVSRVTIAEVTLTPELFTELMSSTITGSVEGAPAFIAPDLDRVGKHMAMAGVTLKTVYSANSDAAEAALTNWASMAHRRIQAYTHSISRHNEGRTSVVFRAYKATEQDATEWTAEAQFLLDELRGTAPGGAA